MPLLNKVAYAALLTLFVVLSCAKAPPAIPFDQKFNQLELGQTTDQVQTLLGPAVLREVKDGKEIWHYQLDDPRDVEFKDKKVVAFFRGTPVNTTGPATGTPALTAPKKIGEDCEANKDCQSLNCHFKTCSGSNNCSKNIGDRCATDRECCSGFCDFAVCKKKF